MSHGTAWGLASATAQERKRVAEQIVDDAWLHLRSRCIEAVAALLGEPLQPCAVLRWERSLLVLVMEFGRILLEGVLNALEPNDPDLLPREVWLGSSCYSRRRDKARNSHVATLFGTVAMWRRGYRNCDGMDRSIFPLELLLGLTEGATPALADWLGREMADAGASQARTLRRLREEHHVSMGVKRLRNVIDRVSEAMAEGRQASQVEALLAALAAAHKSSGNRKPVLAVGRDGITLREYCHRCFEVATAATLSVYDRSGKRLTTMYLAWPPELGQATMTRMLTELLRGVLLQWEGPLRSWAHSPHNLIGLRFPPQTRSDPR